MLQTHTVFTNVSKGQVARKEDIIKAFGTDNQTEVCKQILAKGELQITDKERQSHNEQMFRDIATTVANTCVNPELKRPYPVTIIEKAMKEIHYSIKPNQSTKQQALQVIKLIKENETIPIERAKMRLKVNFRGNAAKKIKEKIMKINSVELESEERADDEVTLVFLIDPGDFKDIDAMVNAENKGNALIEVMSYQVKLAGDEHF